MTNALPSRDDCFELGKISKLQGLDGDLIIFLDVDDPKDYAKLDMFYAEIGGVLSPFFLKSISIAPRGYARIHLEGIDSEMLAEPLVGAKLFLPIERLPDLGPDHFYFHEIIGYDIFDGENPIGKIKDIYDNAAAPLIAVDYNEKEIYIPLQNAFITKVDKPNTRLIMNLPEGLLDL